MVFGHAGLCHPLGVAGPTVGKEQAQADHDGNLVPRQRQRYQRLAVGGLAKRRGVLGRHADRMRPLLRQSSVVHHEHRIGAANQLVRLDSEFLLQRSLTPDRARNEVMQLVVVARRQTRRHRLHALSVPWPDQAFHIKREHPSARLMPKPGNKRRKPSLQISIPARHAVASAKSRSRRSGEIPYKLLICQSSARPCGRI